MCVAHLLIVRAIRCPKKTTITHSEHFFLVGGSHETHERMQDTAIRFGEALERRRKSLGETSREEVVDLLRAALGL
jgi:hypothetical protein